MKTTLTIMCFEFILFVVCFKSICGQSIGDTCTMKSTTSPGTCKLFKECPKAQENLKKRHFPQICGCQGIQPVVCCPNEEKQRKPGEISERKCEEYAPKEITEENECDYVFGFVTGGKPAGRTEFPHMAAIGFEPNPGELEWLCGGTLISPRYILTAAHCLSHFEKGNATWVKLGVTNLNKTKHKQEIKVASFIPHPLYKRSSHYHDIGLIKLEKPVNFTNYARPACLYTKKEIPEKRAVSAIGWGATETSDSSEDLLKVYLNLFNHAACSATYQPYISRRLSKGIIDEIQICAGSKAEMKNTCPGDSGGPLQIRSDKLYCTYKVIGVTSFGTICSGTTGVYVRVSEYVKWIEDIVWPLQ